MNGQSILVVWEFLGIGMFFLISLVGFAVIMVAATAYGKQLYQKLHV